MAETQPDGKLAVIGTQILTATEDLYQLVDFLNRNLKDKNVVFGLSKAPDAEGKMVLTLYRA
ncbi:YpmA family protein [Alicyclobacillus macrosporangiidus]|uniref:YpmA family protein n=1 Tax=Alicyclobacillus macrosporangiidus TaxID=392015 RepID=UPI00049735A6|nr:YpmA family protein [Alicyclobacillus macrosporangiidus]